MTNLLKIAYSFLFPPGIYIILLAAVVGYFMIKKKAVISAILATLTIVVYLSTCSFVGYNMLGRIENEVEFPSTLSGDSIIVLGEGTSPGPTVDGLGELTGDFALNVIAALKLYNLLHVPIIISGGNNPANPNTPAEAQLSKRDLLQMQVPANMIITETNSRTTQENAKYTRQILQELNLRSPLLVTTAAHMPRSVALFEQEGIHVLPVPTRYLPPMASQYSVFDFLPSSIGVVMVQQGLKESLGKLQKYFG